MIRHQGPNSPDNIPMFLRAQATSSLSALFSATEGQFHIALSLFPPSFLFLPCCLDLGETEWELAPVILFCSKGLFDQWIAERRIHGNGEWDRGGGPRPPHSFFAGLLLPPPEIWENDKNDKKSDRHCRSCSLVVVQNQKYQKMMVTLTHLMYTLLPQHTSSSLNVNRKIYSLQMFICNIHTAEKY